jgi:hypothetical protein
MSSVPVDPNESNAPLVQIPGIIFCVVAPIFVAIRFWSRIRIQHALGADDWTIFGIIGEFRRAGLHLELSNAHYRTDFLIACIDTVYQR